MTHEAMTRTVRSWQLVALTAVALLVGYLAGQMAPVAGAQAGAGRVQLDTSNCRMGTTPWYINGVPEGAIITATVADRSTAGQGDPIYIWVTCN